MPNAVKPWAAGEDGSGGNPIIQQSTYPVPRVRFPDYSSLFEGGVPTVPRSAFRLSRFKKLPNEPISVLPAHAAYQQFAKNRAPVGRKNEPIFGAVPPRSAGLRPAAVQLTGGAPGEFLRPCKKRVAAAHRAALQRISKFEQYFSHGVAPDGSPRRELWEWGRQGKRAAAERRKSSWAQRFFFRPSGGRHFPYVSLPRRGLSSDAAPQLFPCLFANSDFDMRPVKALGRIGACYWAGVCYSRGLCHFEF